ncbi:hypothetical protein GOP47_0014576 [Adiantum capillus-veneris]|uniref:Elongin-C n=1 Tax=Adiantum capillus-veneris TaxID=13818 RepID=A0A9D4UMX2_ADICA|nr:hypothetical protein GOP47_0014576 [Adiantum capillus-veneris]
MRKTEIVTLISAEGLEFVIDKKAAMASASLRKMITLSGSLKEGETIGEVRFVEMSSLELEKLCQCLYLTICLQ